MTDKLASKMIMQANSKVIKRVNCPVYAKVIIMTNKCSEQNNANLRTEY